MLHVPGPVHDFPANRQFVTQILVLSSIKKLQFSQLVSGLKIGGI